MAKLRIFLADDHAVLRAGLRMLIEAQADMGVIGEAGTGWEAVRQTKECQPDIIVMDISMPELGGAAATEQIKQVCPRARVLVLTRHGDQGYLRRLLRAGASGYVLKKTAADELINTIRVVAAGGTYLDPSLAGDLLESLVGRSAAKTEQLWGELTERETQVLYLIAWGQSHKEIAEQLDISVKTVEYHKADAAEKLHLRSRTDILRYALAQGWLQEGNGPE
jgi:DNA-binding NarL/FixJ family response regulator